MKTQASEASALRLFGRGSLLVWCLAVSFSVLAEGFGDKACPHLVQSFG